MGNADLFATIAREYAAFRPGYPAGLFEWLARDLIWSFEQALGYVSSWSATARYRKHMNADPVPLLHESLRAVWPADLPLQSLRMPLVLKAARLRALHPRK